MKRIADMTPEEIDALTKEQLIAWIRELEPPPPTDWHSWMDAMLHIALHKYPVEIVREYLLGNQPPRADFLILEEEQVIDLGLRIFKIFREHFEAYSPMPAPVSKINENYRWRVLLKSKVIDSTIETINYCLDNFEQNKSKETKLSFDINPNNMM